MRENLSKLKTVFPELAGETSRYATFAHTLFLCNAEDLS